MKRIKTPGGTFTVQFGTTPITFEVLYSARRTLALQVYPDRAIEVEVPTDTDHATIEAFVKRRGAWILRQLRELARYDKPTNPLPRQYVSGESYRYLGRQYRLKVVADTVERMVLSRGWLTVSVTDPTDRRAVQRLIHGWYRAKAERVFYERLIPCHASVEALGITLPSLGIRTMKRRWGSCSKTGKVTLNLKLIQAPRALIDYVILHELCHLLELNHSPRFWALLTRVIPEWERLRDELNHYEFGDI